MSAVGTLRRGGDKLYRLNAGSVAQSLLGYDQKASNNISQDKISRSTNLLSRVKEFITREWNEKGNSMHPIMVRCLVRCDAEMCDFFDFRQSQQLFL